jgi:hypothetical protein
MDRSSDFHAVVEALRHEGVGASAPLPPLPRAADGTGRPAAGGAAGAGAGGGSLSDHARFMGIVAQLGHEIHSISGKLEAMATSAWGRR